ncbi:DUF2332 family protein [Paracoccaceae bacterium Fryx2]|nr:DUF2332 family protein [Paracoccaceae bacterium Fryx2]
MTEAVRAAFRDQATACAALGSPQTARLLAGLADAMTGDTAVAARVLGWPGDPSWRGESVALRLAGGLHALVLGGQDGALAAAYADPAAVSDRQLVAVAQAAMARHEAFLLRWIDSAPQTNEVRRSAVLIAAGNWLAARVGLPLVLSELGASAGLNLIWDRYRLTVPGGEMGPPDAALHLAPDWHGQAPVICPPVVAARAGVDLNPLDPGSDRLRILSYVWPDQADRLARTAQAAGMAAGLGVHPARGDAVDWLATRLQVPLPGRLHLVFHTIAWQYFTAQAQARGLAMLEAAGTRAAADTPLAHLAMEADGHPDGAAVTLRLWPGGDTIPLGRADFHGRWVDWRAPAA